MSWYSVRSGDTLWSIAERLYGDGQLWSYLADHNALARCGTLYDGQQLAVPPAPPGLLRSLADPSRVALPLGHLPVKLKFDFQSPVYYFWSVVGFCGLVGELTIYRHGAVQLGDFTANRLIDYRFTLLRWAQACYETHVVRGAVSRQVHRCRDRLSKREIWRSQVQFCGPDCTIVGRVGEWQIIRDDEATRAWHILDAKKVIQNATLDLGEYPPGIAASLGNPLPLGRALRAASPHLLSPAVLWAVSREEKYLPSQETLSATGTEDVTSSMPGDSNGEGPRPKSKRAAAARNRTGRATPQKATQRKSTERRSRRPPK